jgi:hypothetical protein
MSLIKHGIPTASKAGIYFYKIHMKTPIIKCRKWASTKTRNDAVCIGTMDEVEKHMPKKQYVLEPWQQWMQVCMAASSIE